MIKDQSTSHVGYVYMLYQRGAKLEPENPLVTSAAFLRRIIVDREDLIVEVGGMFPLRQVAAESL